jgi:hypothetical protein
MDMIAKGGAPDLEALGRLEFRFAKRMPEAPHWYVIRTPANEADYVALFHTISREGVEETFGARRYRYWYAGDGWKYWAMTSEVGHSHVINRTKIKRETDKEERP